jgi:excisionase family DNA binding protein
MQSSSKPFYSTSEAAKLLGVSVTTVQGLVEAGRLAAWKTKGGHRRIPSDSVLAVKRKSETVAGQRSSEHDEPGSTHVGNELTYRGVSEELSPLDIMIVEDDPFVVSLYEGALSVYSGLYNLRVCSDGLEALIELGKRQPDFMLLDIDLPNVNGFEMLRSVHKHQSKRLIQVLVITGVDAALLQQHKDLLSAYNVLTKPVEHQFLKGYLSSLFATRKTATASRA